jgi:hypothetical protein
MGTCKWIIRPDLVVGESAILPPEIVVETKERGLIAGWCPHARGSSEPPLNWRVLDTLRVEFNR